MRRVSGVGLKTQERRSPVGGAGGPPPRALAYRWLASERLSLTGTRVDSWADIITGTPFIPNTPATSEFFFVPGHPSFAGRPVVQNNLASAASRAMVSGSATEWRFLHDGTGMTMVWIALITTGLVGLNTSGGTGANALGVQLARSGGSPRSRSGTGAANVYDTLISNVPDVNAAALWICDHKSSAATPANIRRGSTLLRGVAESTTPNAGDPTNQLELRCDVTSEVSTAEILIYRDALSAPEIAELCRYASLQYGVRTG